MNESASEYVNESFKYILAILNACFQKEKKKPVHTCVLDTFSIVCKSVLGTIAFINWILWRYVETSKV